MNVTNEQTLVTKLNILGRFELFQLYKCESTNVCVFGFITVLILSLIRQMVSCILFHIGNVLMLQFHKAEDKQQLKCAIDNYQSNLRTRSNPKNLKKFVEAFLK